MILTELVMEVAGTAQALVGPGLATPLVQTDTHTDTHTLTYTHM